MAPTHFRYGWSDRALTVAALLTAAATVFGARHIWQWPQKALSVDWLLCGVALVVLLGPALARLYARVEFAGRATPRWLRIGLSLVAVAGLAWLLYQLRTRRFYGDAGAVVAFVKRGHWFHKREPLSPAFFQGVHTLLGTRLGWAEITSIQWTTSTAGALCIWGVAQWARLLTPQRLLLRAVAVAAVITAGTTQLMAGYIENYTVPTMFGVWALYFGTRASLGQGGAIRALLCLVLGIATHLSLITLVPALGWMLWRHHYQGRPKALLSLRRTVPVLLVTLVPLALLWWAMSEVGYLRANEKGFGGGDGLMFVPWSTKAGMSQYLFLRPRHLWAITNLQLMTAPLALLACLVFAGPWLKRGGLLDGPHLTLLLAGFGYFALTVAWNPDLGPRRDWDLFGPVGYYLSLPAVALTLHVHRRRAGQAFVVLALIAAANLSRSLPFFLHNLRM